jgi:methanogenic corrinoid protein MtbC1
MSLNGDILSKELLSVRKGLAREILDRQFLLQPELKEQYTEAHIESYLRDVEYHLDFVTEALRAEDREIYLNFIGWCKTFFTSIGIREKDMLTFYGIMKELLGVKLSKEGSELILEYIDEGISLYKSANGKVPSFIDPSEKLGNVANDYLNYLLGGERRSASDLIMKQVEAGTSVKDLYMKVFQPVQYEIGRLWQTNDINVAQEHYCTATTQLVMSQLYPYIFNTKKNGKRLIAASVSGELHELGIRMIADIFELEGWDTFYLGANTPSSSLIEMIREKKPDIVALSATMTYHVDQVRLLINELEPVSMEINFKTLVGGYPFKISENLWRNVGAHGFAADAEGALKISDNLDN